MTGGGVVTACRREGGRAELLPEEQHPRVCCAARGSSAGQLCWPRAGACGLLPAEWLSAKECARLRGAQIFSCRTGPFLKQAWQRFTCEVISAGCVGMSGKRCMPPLWHTLVKADRIQSDAAAPTTPCNPPPTNAESGALHSPGCAKFPPWIKAGTLEQSFGACSGRLCSMCRRRM